MIRPRALSSSGWLGAVAGVVALALLAFAVHQGLQWRHAEQQQVAREDAMDAAAREVTAFISISKDTDADDMRTLLGGATGEFRDELARQADQLREQAEANRVRSVGTVDSVGVERMNDDLDRATLVVAASGVVRNKSSQGKEPRRYRFRVEVRRAEDDWLVSALEFLS